MKVLGLVFLIVGVLDAVVICSVAAFSGAACGDGVQFCAFMSDYSLWIFLIAAAIISLVGLVMLIFN